MLESQFQEKEILRHYKDSNVYLCLHVPTHIYVEIQKINHPGGLSIRENYELSEDIGRRKVLSNLSTFQRTLHVIKKKDYTWMIMENVGGIRLNELLQHGPLPLEQSKYMFFLLAYTIYELHGRNFAIRDFDPNNFYFFSTMFKYTNYEELVIAEHYNNENELAWIGDVRWMSPESLKGGYYDIEKSNIFCIGLYLYAFLTGKLYPTGHNKGDIHINYTKPDLSSIKGKIDSHAYNLLNLIFDEPDKRPTLRQILNHDFLKPHSPFPHFHPPLQLDPEIEKWLIYLKRDPDLCLDEMKDLNVSENTLFFNLAMLAVIKGHKIEDCIPEKPDMRTYVLLPEAIDCVEEVVNFELEETPKKPSKKEEIRKENSAKLSKLLNFCRQCNEERGVHIQEMVVGEAPPSKLE